MTDEGKNKHKKLWISAGILSLLVILASTILSNLFTRETHPMSRNSSNVRMTILVIKAYASDHDGNYPSIDPESGTLSVLVPDYLEVDYPLYWVHPKTKEKIPWLYNPGLSEASFSRTPLLAQPIPFNGKRIIGYTGGQVLFERDDPEHPFLWPPTPAEPSLADP